MYGTKVTCINVTFSFPYSFLISLAASKNGRISMSPTVPPISVIWISLAPDTDLIRFFISSVI